MQNILIDTGEGVEIGDGDVFIDLMDAVIHRSEFDDLGAEGGDETAIGGAARSRTERRLSEAGDDAVDDRLPQRTGAGQKR